MDSRDELTLPKETTFTQNDLRSIILLPYRNFISLVFPLIEYFSIFLLSGFVRLITSNRVDIQSSKMNLTSRLEHRGGGLVHDFLRYCRLGGHCFLHLAQHQSVQLHLVHTRYSRMTPSVENRAWDSRSAVHRSLSERVLPLLP